MFIGAVLAYFFPSSAYIFVASLSTFGFLFAWFMIAMSQPLYRRKMGAEWVRNLKWKTPLYPLTPIIAIITVLGALVGQFFTGGSGTKVGPITIPGGGLAVVVGAIWTIVWSVYYLAYARRKFTHGAEWRSRRTRSPPGPRRRPGPCLPTRAGTSRLTRTITGRQAEPQPGGAAWTARRSSSLTPATWRR